MGARKKEDKLSRKMGKSDKAVSWLLSNCFFSSPIFHPLDLKRVDEVEVLLQIAGRK
jgi:hypothetical protein